MPKLKQKINYLPLEQAIISCDGAIVYKNRHWCYTEGKGLMFYGKAPQCNHSPYIANSLCSKLYPEANTLFVELAYIPQSYLPQDY